jgi:hypothetical protein
LNLVLLLLGKSLLRSRIFHFGLFSRAIFFGVAENENFGEMFLPADPASEGSFLNGLSRLPYGKRKSRWCKVSAQPPPPLKTALGKLLDSRWLDFLGRKSSFYKAEVFCFIALHI